jgi:hypothetical protein
MDPRDRRGGWRQDLQVTGTDVGQRDADRDPGASTRIELQVIHRAGSHLLVGSRIESEGGAPDSPVGSVIAKEEAMLGPARRIQAPSKSLRHASDGKEVFEVRIELEAERAPNWPLARVFAVDHVRRVVRQGTLPLNVQTAVPVGQGHNQPVGLTGRRACRHRWLPVEPQGRAAQESRVMEVQALLGAAVGVDVTISGRDRKQAGRFEGESRKKPMAGGRMAGSWEDRGIDVDLCH